jgi:hypothetical protein
VRSVAQESVALGQGSFAHALVQALQSPSGDANRNGRLEVNELVVWLTNRMEELAHAAGESRAQVASFSAGPLSDGWVVADLPMTTVPVQAHRSALRAWYGEGLLSLRALVQANDVLDRVTAGAALGPDEREIVRALESTEGPQAARASRLESLLVNRKMADPPEKTPATESVPSPPRGAQPLPEPAPATPSLPGLQYEGSYALLIGVSRYMPGWASLPGVKEDLVAVKAALVDHGFQVETLEDPKRTDLDARIDAFIGTRGLRANNRLLIYFAGHGHTRKTRYGLDMGYVIASDTPLPEKDEEGYFRTALDMLTIESMATRAQSKHVLFVFDSCFAGTIFSVMRSLPENISYKTTEPVRQFITSGSANEKVPDRSIFREEFVHALKGDADLSGDGFLTGTELGEYLQERVTNYSKGGQHPQHGKIRNPSLDKGDFVFVVQPRIVETKSLLEAKVTMQAGTYEAGAALDTLGKLAGGVVIDRKLGARIAGKTVILPSWNQVHLKVALDQLFSQLEVAVAYEEHGDTVVVRERER